MTGKNRFNTLFLYQMTDCFILQYKGLFKIVAIFIDIFVHTCVHSYHKCVHSKILIYHERDLP